MRAKPASSAAFKSDTTQYAIAACVAWITLNPCRVTAGSRRSPGPATGHTNTLMTCLLCW